MYFNHIVLNQERAREQKVDIHELCGWWRGGHTCLLTQEFGNGEDH